MTVQTHYIEIKAIPQVDMLQTEVISFCLQKLHQILPHFGGRIGLAFPSYGNDKTLGGIIRLFGTENDCGFIHFKLQSLRDYALISEVMPIPEKVRSYRIYQRVQPKGQSAIRRAEKRLTAQGKWNEEVLQNMLQKQATQRIYPHVHLKSSSTKQQFILAIKSVHQTKAVEGVFSAYGLSQTATVPHF
ncbi:type I-F CRISPR-associated endoribonuclease Cas6/Csy4 [Aggregatibacter actinomycetemcomitans]|uniref:type I-F CRISPR-associated endoribonuclease Cas6/Csy4 n=1 Tax=Aggregatibacter actinomycetemcomitans TaxID=714 RepID=UPI0011D5A78A|nr:type I-F CRISPR-associated endoribonuclease Cas6/Csy4 [Aggregatibacter actinomycetemcomitans]QEH45289.1 type I-F CRISPR-associated endoribonuclease Cas6/Csy4 [Aggregatibacter actinomycetemcomitans]QEH49782.1 type I-F CRISPR-associated endoribonuclease Cas6/Csy4 [Aggregatibacter actinomycetemcomitans]TYA50609.1 type I-F CRISPR-associated endoribonuclease Cas6/Csy4 [Aggregatibacter actinomycetemcomitans]TYB28715.1 type I-F CRISPR-associated endoribonuclease Cas6/Csy4 [Aggregatibacter actinomyc